MEDQVEMGKSCVKDVETDFTNLQMRQNGLDSRNWYPECKDGPDIKFGEIPDEAIDPRFTPQSLEFITGELPRCSLYFTGGRRIVLIHDDQAPGIEDEGEVHRFCATGDAIKRGEALRGPGILGGKEWKKGWRKLMKELEDDGSIMQVEVGSKNRLVEFYNHTFHVSRSTPTRAPRLSQKQLNILVVAASMRNKNDMFAALSKAGLDG